MNLHTFGAQREETVRIFTEIGDGLVRVECAQDLDFLSARAERIGGGFFQGGFYCGEIGVGFGGVGCWEVGSCRGDVFYAFHEGILKL